MNIPDCYDAVIQAERREAAHDAAHRRNLYCGSCGRIIETGERLYTAARDGDPFPLCWCCKDDIDESETILVEEALDYDV